MPDYTSRARFIKPRDGEPADQEVFNTNFDTIDQLGLGPTICTSGTRPLSPFIGQVIYETDTGRTYQRTSSPNAWTQTGWPTTEQFATGTVTGTNYSGVFYLTRTGAKTGILTAQIERVGIDINITQDASGNSTACRANSAFTGDTAWAKISQVGYGGSSSWQTAAISGKALNYTVQTTISTSDGLVTYRGQAATPTQVWVGGGGVILWVAPTPVIIAGS